VNPSYPFDQDLHEPGSKAARGRCSHHGEGQACDVEAMVSFQDNDGNWQAGCTRALEELVEKGEIEPLGQGA
jgi:hypothetical protein